MFESDDIPYIPCALSSIFIGYCTDRLCDGLSLRTRQDEMGKEFGKVTNQRGVGVAERGSRNGAFRLRDDKRQKTQCFEDV